MDRSIQRFTWVLSLALLCSGCEQGRVVAPVTEGWHQAGVKDSLYTVQEDETLYSIAWSYDVDYRHLAKINHLKAPYDLTAGQKLKVFRGGVAPAKPKQLSMTGPIVETVNPKMNQTVAELSNTDRSVRAADTNEKSQTQQKSSTIQLDSEWLWPANGELVGRFEDSQSGPKGIEIAAKEGSPVFATRAGKVVYSGSGLRGYGKLLIIKHNNEFLSAYAHNSELLVQEGQSVRQGQQIAAVGKTGAGSVKLHFEIRRAGKPVDPMHYLKVQA